MEDADLLVFVKGAHHYFTETTRNAAEVGVPYLKDEHESVMMDFSAVIGVTGNYSGCVFYTAPREMAQQLVHEFGDADQSDAICADYVGEITNTISGHAREDLGAEFLISPPVTLFGATQEVRFPRHTPAFVVPITWQGYRSQLVICLR